MVLTKMMKSRYKERLIDEEGWLVELNEPHAFFTSHLEAPVVVFVMMMAR